MLAPAILSALPVPPPRAEKSDLSHRAARKGDLSHGLLPRRGDKSAFATIPAKKVDLSHVLARRPCDKSHFLAERNGRGDRTGAAIERAGERRRAGRARGWLRASGRREGAADVWRGRARRRSAEGCGGVAACALGGRVSEAAECGRLCRAGRGRTRRESTRRRLRVGWGRRVAWVARAGAMAGRWVTRGGRLAYHGWLTIGGDGRASAG